MNASQIADSILSRIIKDIRDRSGIGNEWENIDVDVRNNIARTWRYVIVSEIEGAADHADAERCEGCGAEVSVCTCPRRSLR